jgi:DNA polymerase
MQIITLDFESFFSNDYSLSKMTTESYVRDPRFEAHGVAIRWPDGVIEWLDGEELAELGQSDRGNHMRGAAVLCHHSAFDGLILNHHYGIRPAAWLDTLSMSRLLLGTHVKHSLDGLRAHFGMSVKRTPYHLFKGRRWSELNVATQALVAEGACDEVESIYRIFCRFMSGDY